MSLAFRRFHQPMATAFQRYQKCRRHSIFTEAFYEAVSRPSKIIFSCNNEHVDSEKLLLDVLRKERPSEKFRALTICGGGDNFMSILADSSVESVLCVDMNPFQLILAQLKLAVACSKLTTHQALGFLGMNDSVNRLEVYEKELEPLLPLHVSDSIREHLMHEISWGIIHFGVQQDMFRHFNRIFANEGFDKKSLWDGPTTVDLEALEGVCQRGIGTAEQFVNVLRFNEVLPLSQSSEFLRKWEQDVFPKVCMGLYRIIAYDQHKNFINAMAIMEKYDESSLPPWLLPQMRKVLRNKKMQVTFLESSIIDVPTSDVKYELVSPSNIFDWMDIETASETLEIIADRFLSPDGYLLLRLGLNDRTELLDSVGNLRMSDTVRPEELAAVEVTPMLFRYSCALGALRLESD